MMLDTFYKKLDELLRTKNVLEAEKYAATSLKIAESENDLPAKLAISNELGGILRVTGRYEEAKKIYADVIRYIAKLNLNDTEQHGTTLQNLASVLSESGDPAGALELYKRVEGIYNDLGLVNDYAMAALHNNMSHAYERLGEIDESITQAEQALLIIRNLKDNESELATTYTTLASRYIERQNYEKAQECLKKAEAIFLAMQGKPDVHFAATLNTLGELCYIRGDYTNAADNFSKALEIIKASYGETRTYTEVLKNLEKARNAIKPPENRITGMDLAEDYFNTFGRAMIQNEFAKFEQYMAIGLVGEGSDCFGFDDEISRSHDFGPGFCIWLQEDLYDEIGQKLKRAYESLPRTFRGYQRIETEEGRGRVGVFSIQGFMKKYIGCTGVPQNNVEWLFIPETNLATVTNGKIFADPAGEFTRIREALISFYPEDVRLKKIAARIAMMSQTGQYNYGRCIRRREYEAAYISCAEFIRTTVSLVYLLNRKYMPFYKWMFRGMDELETLGWIRPILARIAAMPDTDEMAEGKVALIEDICIKVLEELKKQKMVTGSDSFLNNHAREVLAGIKDPQIRNLPVMFDGR